jgi:trehalose utilization protein
MGIRALVWSEGTAPKSAYPNDINATIAEHLNEARDISATIASLDEPEQGLAEERLDNAEVLLWWGHQKHNQVTDENVERVARRVREGRLGLCVLHSAHYSRIFKHLNGTPCGLGAVREVGESEYIRVVAPDHPIARGISDFVVEKDEMYGEPFTVPTPDRVIFHATFSAGFEDFRAGCVWQVGKGRMFYFSPGHETYRIYHQPEICAVLKNAVRWSGGRA